jgi:type I restriction enzyme S subunit
MQNSVFWANGTVPWVSSGDVKSVSLSDSPMKITDYAVKNSSTTVLPKDSIIVVVRSGILRKYLPVARNTRPLAINQDIKALIPDANHVPSYLLHLLTWSGPKILATCLKSGTTVESIEFRWLKSFRIPLPPTKVEQEAITEVLSDADALIESLEQLIAKKRQIKQGAMQELLTGKKRLPGFATKPGYKQTEVGEIPEDWEVMHVRDLVKHGPKNGYSGRSGQDSRGTPTLSLAATSSGRLVLNQDTVKYLENRIPTDSPLFLEPGDILVQRSNTAELVGTTAIFNGPAATFVYPDLIMRLRFKKRATAEWFWRYANSTSGRRFFSRVAAGSTGSMPKISGDKLRDMVVPLPPLTEQEAITAILSDMDAEVAALEAKLAKARQLKQGMMQELLTGKTRLVESEK